MPGADALQNRVLGEVLAQHRFDPPLVLDQVEPFEPGDVRLRRELRVVDVEDLRRDARRRALLLVLHDPAQLAPQTFEMMDLHRLPEVLAPHLLDGVGLGLHGVLVLGEQLDRLFDARTQVLHLGSVRPALDAVRPASRVIEQVEAIGVLVAADASQVLKRRGDGEQVGLRRRGEVVDSIAVGEHLELPPPVSRVDAVRVPDRPNVADDERGRRLEGGLIHLVERRLRELDARLEEVLEQRLLRRGLLLLVLLVEEPEVRPVVEDQELSLVSARAEQVLAQPRAAADHLPELHVGLDRLGEDEVDDLGHVDAGVEHVDRDGDGQLVRPGS